MHGLGKSDRGCDLTKDGNIGEAWCEFAKSVGKVLGNNAAGHTRTADDTGRRRGKVLVRDPQTIRLPRITKLVHQVTRVQIVGSSRQRRGRQRRHHNLTV